MRVSAICLLMMSCVLSGCGRQSALSGPGPKNQGRYAGIGTFDAGRLWGEMAGAADPADAATAKLADDEHIIVVIDSHTGEVRQCGDHSGFCVTMNPWTGQGLRSAAPVKLNKHAADLAAEDRAGLEVVEAPANGSVLPGKEKAAPARGKPTRPIW